MLKNKYNLIIFLISSIILIPNIHTNQVVKKVTQASIKAAKKEFLLMVRNKIKEGEDLNKKSDVFNINDGRGFTILHRAVLMDSIAAIKALLNNKAEIDVREGIIGKTPLLLAVEKGKKDIVELLLKKGANHKRTDFIGCNALLYASIYHQPDIAKIIIQHILLSNNKK